MHTPPIVVSRDGELLPSGDKLIHEVMPIEEFGEDELMHLCTMVFPDVRAKNYIEVRMADGLPYPLNLAVVALWKGLLYNQENLDKLTHRFSGMTTEDVVRAKASVRLRGFNALMRGEPLMQLTKDVLTLAQQGLPEEERCYIQPAIELAEGGISPAKSIGMKLDEGLDKALSSSVIQR